MDAAPGSFDAAPAFITPSQTYTNGIGTVSLPPTRREARARGLPRYFTGLPCSNGHVSDRYTSQAKCVACAIEQSVAWRASNPDFLHRLDRQKKLVRDRRWARDNRELKNIRDRQRYGSDPSGKREAAAKWSRDNPDKRKAITNKYRAAKVAAEGSHTANDLSAIHRAQKGRCAECHIKLTSYHADHIVPLSKGGTNWPRNIQLLCPTCNLRKGDFDPIEWAVRVGRLC